MCDAVDLASNWEASPAANPVWHFVQVGGGIALLIGIVAVFLQSQLRSVRYGKSFRGPALNGTAEVLAAARRPGLQPAFVFSNSRRAVLCDLQLRVQLPGREPYDAAVIAPIDSEALIDLCVVGQRWEPSQPWKVKPHKVFPVQVDSTNLQLVRVDFRRPIPQS
jgi:hypothetical protein